MVQKKRRPELLAACSHQWSKSSVAVGSCSACPLLKTGRREFPSESRVKHCKTHSAETLTNNMFYMITYTNDKVQVVL